MRHRRIFGVIMVNKIQKLLLEQLTFLKIVIVAIMGITAFFVKKENVWSHWSWIVYGALFVLYLAAEFVQHKQNARSPLEKIKKHLLDFNGWTQGGVENSDYYNVAPEYTIRANDEENHLDFTQEWTRGEIGASYNTGNSAYYADLYFYETCLKQIHIVIFDGGKKTVVAPNWEAIGTGRIYFYLENSVEYAYQKFLSSLHQKDFSKNIRKQDGQGSFDIPVFKNEAELDKFIVSCNQDLADPETNREQQNKIFYQLVDKCELRGPKKGVSPGVILICSK